jgi:hypothetical protein
VEDARRGRADRPHRGRRTQGSRLPHAAQRPDRVPPRRLGQARLQHGQARGRQDPPRLSQGRGRRDLHRLQRVQERDDPERGLRALAPGAASRRRRAGDQERGRGRLVAVVRVRAGQAHPARSARADVRRHLDPARALRVDGLRARRSHDGDGLGDQERQGNDRAADAPVQQGAAGRHHQGAHGDRRRQRGAQRVGLG